MVVNINWELQGCCRHNQVVFIAAVGISTVVILAVSTPPHAYSSAAAGCRSPSIYVITY
jgi:hypothetical protein